MLRYEGEGNDVWLLPPRDREMNVPGVIASPSAEGCGNLCDGYDVRFFAEFILSWGIFFDRLRMSGRKSRYERGEESE